MVTNRTPLQRERLSFNVTPEMLRLFERCLQLVAAGHDRPGEDSDEHREFVVLSRELEWTLLQLPPHCVSIFDPEIAEGRGPSPYLSSSHAMHRDWGLVLSWRAALMQALEARR
jgi:hypothetical protein